MLSILIPSILAERSYSIDITLITNTDTHKMQENDRQKPNIYNQYSPFHEDIKRRSSVLFDEIRENLSRTIQLNELAPGFAVWSEKLKQFITLYGYNFNKVDHLKFVNLYLSILFITDLNYEHAKTCFDTLLKLLRFVFNFLFNPF